MKGFYTYIFIGLLFLSSGTFAYAQIKCLDGENQTACRARLLAEQKRLEAEVKRLEGDIKQEDVKQQNISGEIKKLRGEINKTASAIKKKTSLIAGIRNEISSKEKSLGDLNAKLKREKESLEKILRKRNELEESTILEFIFAGKTLSRFYEDLPAFSYVQSSLSDSFEYIGKLKEEIYGEKVSLERKKEQENNERYSLSLEKGKIETQKKDRDVALKVSKSKEASLSQLKKLREKEIKEIRAKLIQFRGNGITRSISFGEAYDYAKKTEEKTGVRAAFIMGIMQQETAFGNNVGGCYLTKKPKGLVNGKYEYDGIYIKSGKPSRKNMIPSHFDAFVRITSSLGRDWKTTPVSCVLIRSNGSMYGWGGAMGYTQFIPGTWELVAPRIKKYLGISTPNPWNARDAVMATGIYLKDRGAAVGTYTAERTAACRYYGACSTYADSVMRKAANIQKTIQTLERN